MQLIDIKERQENACVSFLPLRSKPPNGLLQFIHLLLNERRRSGKLFARSSRYRSTSRHSKLKLYFEFDAHSKRSKSVRKFGREQDQDELRRSDSGGCGALQLCAPLLHSKIAPIFRTVDRSRARIREQEAFAHQTGRPVRASGMIRLIDLTPQLSTTLNVRHVQFNLVCLQTKAIEI